MRLPSTRVLPAEVSQQSMTMPRDRLVKTAARIIRDSRAIRPHSVSKHHQFSVARPSRTDHGCTCSGDLRRIVGMLVNVVPTDIIVAG